MARARRRTLAEKTASDYIRAAVDVGVSYESATREGANELDREVDVLVARLAKFIEGYKAGS